MSVTEELTLSKDELEAKANILLEAEEIKDNDAVYQAVQRYMRAKAGKFTRIADLRNVEASGQSPRKEADY